MSAAAENDLDVVRRSVEAFNARDLAAFTSWTSPEIEFAPLRHAIEGRVYRGHQGLLEFFRDSDASWTEVRMEPGELRDVGKGEVLLLGRLHAVAAGSEMSVDQEIGQHFRLVDGLIVSVVTYPSRAEALAAVQAE